MITDTKVAPAGPEQSPRKSIYYGWANLVIAALAMVGTLPGRTQGLGLITEPLIADLHIDRVSYAGINLWATLIGAAFCLPCGRLTDRFGSRIVLTGVLLALGGTVLVMSHTAGFVILCLTITLTRGFGQSALSVVSLALVGKWFARRLNLAMGVYSLLVGLGFIAAFPLVGHAVLKHGWRAAWSEAGLVLVLVAAPLAWLLVRNNPEERGFHASRRFFPSLVRNDRSVREQIQEPGPDEPGDQQFRGGDVSCSGQEWVRSWGSVPLDGRRDRNGLGGHRQRARACPERPRNGVHLEPGGIALDQRRASPARSCSGVSFGRRFHSVCAEPGR